ncbi:hypothetical protein BDV97DRAFT_90283 [Delphinella strobiligena]|nr:hypothetical protein BDV97DRAFT_90283 [Delphinella strobiligena]
MAFERSSETIVRGRFSDDRPPHAGPFAPCTIYQHATRYDRSSIVADVWVGASRRATWPNSTLQFHLSASIPRGGLEAMYFWVPRHVCSINPDSQIQTEVAAGILFQSYRIDDIKVNCVDSHVSVDLKALSLNFDSTAMQRRQLHSCICKRW